VWRGALPGGVSPYGRALRITRGRQGGGPGWPVYGVDLHVRGCVGGLRAAARWPSRPVKAARPGWPADRDLFNGACLAPTWPRTRRITVACRLDHRRRACVIAPGGSGGSLPGIGTDRRPGRWHAALMTSSRRLVSSGSPLEPEIGMSRAVRSGPCICVAGTAPIAEGRRHRSPSRTGHLWLAFADIERQHFPWHARGLGFESP
jgi:hypothetical protein